MLQVGKQSDTKSALKFFFNLFLVRNTEKSEKWYHSQISKRHSNSYINFKEEMTVHHSGSGNFLWQD